MKYSLSLVALAMCALSFFALTALAHAALYNASGLLGHVDQDGTLLFDAGGTNNTPNSQVFNSARNVALDTINHRLFVSDYYNNRVLVFTLDTNNQIASTSASYILGQADFGADGAATTQNGLRNPFGLAYDASSSRLFVADYDNNRVLIFDAATSTIANGEDAENVLGQADFTSKTATTTQSGLTYPQGLAYDPSSSRLFVADQNNNRVLVFDASTSTIQDGKNAENVLGQADFTSNTATTTQSGLWGPSGVALDTITHRLFVADQNSSRVVVFDVATSTITNGENAEHVLGQADFTSDLLTTTQSGLWGPSGVALDTINHRLFVADYDNNRVLIFDAATSTIANGEDAENVLGQADFTSKTATTTQSGLTYPQGLAYDPSSSRLFVADQNNNRVLVFDASTSTIQDGKNAENVLGQSTFTSPGSATSQNGLNGPQGVALDTINHRLFVSDDSNDRILVFALDASNQIASTTASYVLGQADFTSRMAATTQNGLNTPRGLAYDASSSRLFVADYGNNRVLVFDAATSTIANGEDAENVLGQASFTLDIGTTTQNGLHSPWGIALDTINHRLFVTDLGNMRVVVFDAATSTITNGEDADNVLGQADFTSHNAGFTQSVLFLPRGLAYDPSAARLFVADQNNSRVVVFDVATSTIANGENAENVLGQANFTSRTAATTQDGLHSPFDLAYDPSSSRLFVADSSNSRVVVFDVATSTIANGENAENVLGQAEFTSNTGATTQSGLGGPESLAYDPSSSRLFVADSSNHRVLQYSFIRMASSLSSVAGAVGTPLLTDPINTTSSQGTVNFALAAGTLPDGLTFSTSTGVISGIPTVGITTSLTIEADDTFSTGKFFDRKSFTLTVASPPPPAVVIVPVPVNHATPVTLSPTVSSSSPPEAASSTPSLPSISSSTHATSSPSVASLQAILASLEAKLQVLTVEAQGRGLDTPPSSNQSTASASASTSPRNLSLWMTGDDVHALQAFLNTHGYPVATSGNGSLGHETFTFGNKTYAALVRFQKDQGIPATGFFGPITRARVNALEGSGHFEAPATDSTESIAPPPASPSGASPSVSFETPLSLGSSGPEVKALQQLLIADGDYPSGVASGNFDLSTESAVKAFQTKYGILSYGSPALNGFGNVGPKTLAELTSLEGHIAEQ